jgi:ABC-2 type transport system permease protein
MEDKIDSENIQVNSTFNAIRMVYNITFNQAIRGKKTILMLILTFLPAIFTAYYSIAKPENIIPPNFLLYQITLFYLLFASILVSLFYGTAIVGDEIDNKTIIYLFTRPIPKYTIIIGKFIAYIVGVILIMVPPIIISLLIIATDSSLSGNYHNTLDMFSKQLGVIILSLLVYGSIFTFFGARVKHPMIVGLLFAFGWEKIMLIVPGIIRKFSIVHYLVSLFPVDTSFHSTMETVSKDAFFSNTSGGTISIIIISLVTVIFLGLTVLTVYTKEYKFE